MTRYELLSLVIGWLLTVFIAALAAAILIKVWRNEIDLKFLISDENGDASLSRFQFLVFTLVVAMSLLYLIVIKTPPDFPTIPNQVLALLGISGGSYVLSKSIQSKDAENKPSEVTKMTTEVVEQKNPADTGTLG